MKYSVLLAQFPDNRGTTFIGPTIWMGRLMAKLEADQNCHQVDLWYKPNGDTPITMLRNLCLLDAEKRGVDLVLMVDSDNVPDLYAGIDPEAKPFWDSSLHFWQNHGTPCVIAAPYCGGPPDESCHAFRWVNHQTNDANPDFAIKTITRHEASQMRGFKPCAAAATGVILIDMRAVKKLDHPRFAYEWKDKTESVKATTEDVYFTRNLTYQGVPVYIAWDSWAGHIKQKLVGRPVPVYTGSITRQLRRAAREQTRTGEIEKVGTQEEPIRVRPVNTYKELPPTIDPATVTPAGVSVLHAGDTQLIDAVRRDRLNDPDDPRDYVHGGAKLDAAEACRQAQEMGIRLSMEQPVQPAKNGETEIEESIPS